MTNEMVQKTLSTVSAAMIQNPIQTKRIHIRPFSKPDFADYYIFATDQEQQRLSGNPELSTEAEVQSSFEGLLSPSHPPLSFAIEYKPERKVIGCFSIGIYPFIVQDQRFDTKRGVSLSYSLSRAYWKRGLMTEVLLAAVPFFFENADLDFINSGYFEFNEGSRKLHEKCGFHYYMDHIYRNGGKEIPTHEMILLREDYPEWKRLYHAEFVNCVANDN